ncbi:MAG: hypothetical protein ACK4R3_01885 [Aliihoeflea sp.]
MAALNLLRFVAAFGVVLAHALNPRPIAAIGYAALIFLLIMMADLSIHQIERRGARKNPFVNILQFRRIVLPFVSSADGSDEGGCQMS